jgi:hypothetical protein
MREGGVWKDRGNVCAAVVGGHPFSRVESHSRRERETDEFFCYFSNG